MQLLSHKENINETTVFLILLLNELNGKADAAMRILSLGVRSSQKIVSKKAYRVFVNLIQEAVILKNYHSFIEEDGFISAVKLSKDDRLVKLSINRQTVIRTFKKYGIEYSLRKKS